MRQATADLISQLDLNGAVEKECADQVRNQLPREPWRDRILGNSEQAAEMVRAWLLAGRRCVPSTVVNARKLGRGTRPVPIMGIVERVVYRALCEWILSEEDLPKRSAAEYRDFLRGPVQFERDLHQPGPISLGSMTLGYVVETDVAAFYQYVDHEILRRELEMRTGKVDEVDLLTSLLRETEGRTFGIPQLFDASDDLSEMYIQIVERDLVRKGLRVWRFNDDFRIGCDTYQDALDSIELLEESARAVGLTISDYKTYTPTFLTYFMKNSGVAVDENAESLNPDDFEAVVTDYADLTEQEAVGFATSVLERISSQRTDSEESTINIRDIRGDEIRELRRAFASLSFHNSAEGLSRVVEVFTYLPSLTPSLCNYLMKMWSSNSGEVDAIITELQGGGRSRSEWQSMWLVATCRTLGAITTPDRVGWIRSQRDRGRFRVLGAEAALALAGANAITFEELDESIRVAPEALAPWFVMAMESLVGFDSELRHKLNAVLGESPLFPFLVAN